MNGNIKLDCSIKIHKGQVVVVKFLYKRKYKKVHMSQELKRKDIMTYTLSQAIFLRISIRIQERQ